MHQQFRYALLLLALALFGFASVGYSQDANKQANSAGQLNEEPDSLETRFKNLEDQFNVLQSEFSATKTRLNALEDAPGIPFQTFVMIFVVLVILAFAVVIFFGLRMVQQHRRRSDEITQRLQGKLDESVQGLQKSLDYVRQGGRDNTEKLKEAESKQSLIGNEQENIHNAIAEIKGQIDKVDLTLANLESDGETDNIIDYQLKVESIVQETRAQVVELARGYTNGEPIDFVSIETPTPSQNVLLILNWIARNLGMWIAELEQVGTANPDLIQTLGYAERAIKDKLKTLRGEVPPSPTPLALGTEGSTDTEFNEIQNQCSAYVARFEGMLFGYQLGCTINEAEYNQFIPQFIKDRLFNGIARFVPFDQLPEQVDEFLQLVGYEVVPIEVGTTKAESRVHEIQGSRQTGVEPGTIVEVVLPGLRRKTDGEIVQKPVVIRGE